MQRFLLALVLAGVALSPANGQTIRYHETLTPVTNAVAQSLTTCVADVAVNFAYVSVETTDVRWWDDGTAPTAATGHLASVGRTLTITGHTNVVNFAVISTGANATVVASCGRP
jgi:hypothetical protein